MRMLDKSLTESIYMALNEEEQLPIPRATRKEIEELDELGKDVDPKIKEIIDRFTSLDEKTAFFGNRSWLYRMFSNKNGNDRDIEIIKMDIDKAFDDTIKNNIQAISHQLYPYDREPGFLMIYKDNIFAVCVYNSGVYCGTNSPRVMLHNEFSRKSSDTFQSKDLRGLRMTAEELDKSLLPIPEDTLTPKIDQCRHILFEPEQLSLDLGLDEGTIYKYDRDRGYGYFTSDGKEDKPKEEPKKKIERTDFSNDNDFLAALNPGDSAELEGGYKITNHNGTYQISSTHPYDETDYSFAKSSDGITWIVVDPEKRTLDMQHVTEPQKKYTIKIDGSNPAVSEDDLTVVLDKMKEIDSTKKPRIDRS